MNNISAQLTDDTAPRMSQQVASPPSGFRELDARVKYFVRGDAVQNFGDYLPELLAHALLLQPRVDADIYRLIGSVIESSWVLRDLRQTLGVERGSIAYWGCGMRDARPLSKRAHSLCAFFGVRGPLTRDALKLPADTVLGDPGLLAPLFHTPTLAHDTAGKVVCMPHIHDSKADAELLAISGAEMVLRPQIAASNAALRRILDQIASARFLLTASLHGAVIACAYGKPFAFWDNGHVDIVFKWQDFAASVGIPPQFVKTAREGEALYRDTLAPRLALPPLATILDVCPFSVRPSAMLRALAHDGQLSGPDVDAVARAFEGLASEQPARIEQWQRLSARHRARHDGVRRAVRRRGGEAVEAAKRLIRNLFKL